MNEIDQVIMLFDKYGDSLYGGEAISQRDHAIQAAMLAENENATPALIVAALLHDVGHLIHDLPEDASEKGIDDRHELLGEAYLESAFGPEVAIPVRLHVAAKRYLCAVDEHYGDQLSYASQVSLRLQGGPFNIDEIQSFENLPYWENAVRLRRWDDLAKVKGMVMPEIRHFAGYMKDVLEKKPQ
ncbi:MAG: phosphonate degradation HD-domain oxygenase [Rubripirellula sp.]